MQNFEEDLTCVLEENIGQECLLQAIQVLKEKWEDKLVTPVEREDSGTSCSSSDVEEVQLDFRQCSLSAAQTLGRRLCYR